MIKGLQKRPHVTLMALAVLVILLAATVPPGSAAGQGWRNKNCGDISNPKIYSGAAMELYVYGHQGPLPTCKLARRKVPSATARLPKGTWGRLGGWKCRWSSHEVFCRRGGNLISVATPGGG